MTIHQDIPPALLNAASHELEKLARQTEALGAGLCADPRVAEAHGEALQSFDLIAQSLLQLSKIIGAQTYGDAIGVIDEIGLQELQDQFQQVCLAPDADTCG